MRKTAKVTQVEHTLYWDTWNSPFGEITVLCSGMGICKLELGRLSKQGARAKNSARANAEHLRANGSKEPGAKLARQAIAELREYALGRRKRFTVPLDLQGTSFQMKVWKALLAIPHGETRSYQDIARAVGNPKASRAVGMANHWNPVAIIVPCHRVIASDGSLGGYGGGLDMKRKMLELEQGSSSVKRI